MRTIDQSIAKQIDKQLQKVKYKRLHLDARADDRKEEGSLNRTGTSLQGFVLS